MDQPAWLDAGAPGRAFQARDHAVIGDLDQLDLAGLLVRTSRNQNVSRPASRPG
jgi:hypothetical protein